MLFSEKEIKELVRETAEETTQMTAEFMMEVVRDVLEKHYEYTKPEVAKFLMFMGLEMITRNEDEKDD